MLLMGRVATRRKVGKLLGRLRAARMAKGSQAVVAEILDASQAAISNIERGLGQPSEELLRRFAQFVALPLEDVVAAFAEEKAARKREVRQ